MSINEYLAAHREDMVRQLGELVQTETPTDHKAQVDLLSRRLQADFQAAGAQVERLPQERYGDAFRAEWGAGAEQVLLLGHMDTVWPLGTTGQRPWHVAGQKGTGPGCYDMKGGLVIGLWALKALAATGVTPRVRLVYLITGDEEVGSPTSRPALEAEARRSKLAMVLEPSPNGAAVVSRKGVGRFAILVQGRESHAGVDHARGVSAIEELARQVLILQGMTDYATGTTVNVGTCHGGTRPNVVAGEARAEIDLRVTTPQEAERMTAAILGLKRHNPATRIAVTGGLNRPPWAPTAEETRLFEQYCAAARALGMDLVGVSVGGGTDGSFCAAVGTPVLDGLGIAGYGAHAVDEWVDLDSLPSHAALVATFIAGL